METRTIPPSTCPTWRGTATSTPTSVVALAPAWASGDTVRAGEVRYSAAHGTAFYAVLLSGSTQVIGSGTDIGNASPGGVDYPDATNANLLWRRLESRAVTVQNEDGTNPVRVGGPDLTATVGGFVASQNYGTVKVDIDDPAKVYVYAGADSAINVSVTP